MNKDIENETQEYLDRMDGKSLSHTPGPWHCGTLRETGINAGIDVDADNNSNLALVHHEPLDRDSGETKANARLIAAAPDLLAALEGLLADIAEYQTINKLGGEKNHWQVQARAAIAKATGQP